MLREPERVEMVKWGAAPLHDRSDPAVCQVRAQSIAPIAADFVILEDVEVAPVRSWTGREPETGDASERLVIPCGNVSTTFDGLGVPPELERKDRRVDVIDARVGAPNGASGGDGLVGAGPVIAHRAHLCGECVVVGDERSGVAETAERLGRIETERTPAAERARSSPVELGTERLR